VLEDQIDAADALVLCLTHAARRSEWVGNETNWALLQRKHIYIARCQPDVLPPFALNRLPPIDCYDPYFEMGAARLCGWLNGTILPASMPSEVTDPFADYLKRGLQSIVDGLRQRLITPEPIPLSVDQAPGIVGAPPPPNPFAQAFSPVRRPDLNTPTTAPGKPFTDFASTAAHFQRRVLLLGAPGAGKTITLMDYARQAFYNRLQDSTQPLPLFGLVPLWDAQTQPALADWLAESHGMDAAKVRDEMDAGRALLLLDGLDELGGEREDQEIKELYDPRIRFMNALRNTNPANGVILTCREEDYPQLDTQTTLVGALKLLPLAWQQIQTYLADQPQLLRLIATDDDLKALAQTPLLLSLLSFSYAGLTPTERDDLNHLNDARDLRDRIFLDYVRQRYRHEAGRSGIALPFDQEEFLDLLGRVAVANAAFATDNLLRRHNFEEAAGNQSPALITLGRKLRVLADTGWGNLRFVHLLLRDALVYRTALPALADPKANRRRRAADALRQIADPRSIEALITALSSDPDDIVRHTVAEALREIADPRAVEPLITALTTDPDDFVRLRVAGALRRITDPRVVEPLIAALGSDPDPIVRRSAAIALKETQDSRAVEPLMSALRSDPDALVRLRAAEALGDIADPRTVETLITTLHSDSYAFVRRRAADALARIDTPEARAALDEWRKQRKR
jgi:hypothetical protein